MVSGNTKYDLFLHENKDNIVFVEDRSDKKLIYLYANHSLYLNTHFGLFSYTTSSSFIRSRNFSWVKFMHSFNLEISTNVNQISYRYCTFQEYFKAQCELSFVFTFVVAVRKLFKFYIKKKKQNWMIHVRSFLTFSKTETNLTLFLWGLNVSQSMKRDRRANEFYGRYTLTWNL